MSTTFFWILVILAGALIGLVYLAPAYELEDSGAIKLEGFPAAAVITNDKGAYIVESFIWGDPRKPGFWLDDEVPAGYSFQMLDDKGNRVGKAVYGPKKIKDDFADYFPDHFGYVCYPNEADAPKRKCDECPR